MTKIYRIVFVWISLLMPVLGWTQSISLIGQSAYNVCAGSVISVSFTTSGTFVADNTFRLQLSSNYGSSFIDLPGSFTSSPASLTVPATAAASNGNTNYQYRIVASKPLAYSPGSNGFRVSTTPSAQLTGNSVGNDAINPYTFVSLRIALSGGSSYTMTMKDGKELIKNDDYSYSNEFSFTPTRTTTYALASVRNGCGTGPASGSTVVNVNSVGFLITPLGNVNACLGQALPVYFSANGPLPANTIFEAELISTANNNRSITLPVSGTTSPLMVQLPTQLLGQEAWGYKLRIFSRTSDLSGWYNGGSTFTLNVPPRLALSGTANSIPYGGQTSVILSYTSTGTGYAVLNDGQRVNIYDAQSGTSTYLTVRPTETTSYSIAAYTGACPELVSYGERSVRVAVLPGARFDSLSTYEACAGSTVKLYYSTSSAYVMPGQLSVKLDYWPAINARLIKPGQVEFTLPASMSPIQSSRIQLRRAVGDSLLMDYPYLTFKVKTPPSLTLTQSTQVLPVPGERYIEGTLLGNSSNTEVVLSTGNRYVLKGGYYVGYYTSQYASMPVYVSETTTYSVVSVRNECGVGTTAQAAVQFVVNGVVPITGVTIRAADINQVNVCPGSKQWINVFGLGTFEAGNQYQLEISDASGNYPATPLLTTTKAESMSFTWPTNQGFFRIRVSTTKPQTKSNELSFYNSNVNPTGYVGVSAPGGAYNNGSYTVVAGQTITVTYSFYGRYPVQYELLDGTQGTANYNLSATYQPTASQTYGIKRFTDACGISTTAITQQVPVTVVPLLLTTDNAGSYACVDTPVSLPFLRQGSPPVSVSYVAQVSTDQLVWQTVPTSGTASPLTVRFPAAFGNKQWYYRVAAVSAEGTVTGSAYYSPINVYTKPNVLLTSPTNTTVVFLESTSAYLSLKLTDAYSYASVLISNGVQVRAGETYSSGNTFEVSTPGTYSIISALNNYCGYGQSQGVVRVMLKPTLTEFWTSKTSYCGGETVTLQYNAGGDFEAGNKLSFYLIDYSGNGPSKSLLTQTAALSGTYSFSLSPTLKGSYYVIQCEASAPATVMNRSTSFYVQTPISMTLTGGSRVLYKEPSYWYSDPPLLPVLVSGGAGGPYTYTLTSPSGVSAITGESMDYLYLPQFESGTYTLTGIRNQCGVGVAKGSYSVTILSGSTVTIRPNLYNANNNTVCVGKSLFLSLETTGTFAANNTFTAYLSDSTGTNNRALPTISSPNYLTVTLPTDLPATGSFQVRVGSSNPQHLGASLFQPVKLRAQPTGTLTGNTSIFKGDSTRISVALTGTPPWQFVLTDFFGPRTFTTSTSPYTLTVKPDTTVGFRLAEVRDSQCGLGTATGTALITVTKLLATEPALPLQVRPWPNPTTGWLQIEGDVPGRGDVLFGLHTVSGTLVGQSVGSVRQGQLQHRIDLSKQPAGVYILTAEQEGRRSQFKVLKQ